MDDVMEQGMVVYVLIPLCSIPTWALQYFESFKCSLIFCLHTSWEIELKLKAGFVLIHSSGFKCMGTILSMIGSPKSWLYCNIVFVNSMFMHSFCVYLPTLHEWLVLFTDSRHFRVCYFFFALENQLNFNGWLQRLFKSVLYLAIDFIFENLPLR